MLTDFDGLFRCFPDFDGVFPDCFGFFLILTDFPDVEGVFPDFDGF